jgi:hypothetical protein
MVNVVIFPKKCPHCNAVMTFVKKMYYHWLQCDNDSCPAFVPEDNTGGESRYTYAESSH